MGCACVISKKAIQSTDLDLTHKIIESTNFETFDNANNSSNKLSEDFCFNIKKTKNNNANNKNNKPSFKIEKSKNEEDIILSGPIITLLKRKVDLYNKKKKVILHSKKKYIN